MTERDLALSRQKTGTKFAWGDAASILIVCLAGLGVMLPLVSLLMIGLVGGQALRAPATPALQPLDVNLGDKIGLQGFALDETGDTLAVHLAWLARQPMDEWNKWILEYLGNEPSNYILLHPPHNLPSLSSEQIAHVKWQAGMHLSADPQHRLDLGLDLAGWRQAQEKTGRTYNLGFYTQQEPSTLVYTLPATREYQGGLRILGPNLYHATLPDGQHKLTGDLAWESGRYERPLSLSLRLHAPCSSTRVQTDNWLLDARGQDATSWRSGEQGTTLLELVASDLPAGEYQLDAIPYFTDTLEPIPSSEGYNLGTVNLP